MHRVSTHKPVNGILQLTGSLIRTPRTFCLLGVLFLLELLLAPVVEAIRNGEEIVLSLMLGAIVGQCAIVAILGSLYGTTWFDGFIPAGFAVVVGVLFFFLGILIDEGSRPLPPDFWPVFGMIPGIIFAVFAPLLLMRHFANWQLVEPGRVYPKQPANLTSIFINTTTVAAIIMLLRMPQLVWDVRPTLFWPWSMAAGLIIVLVSGAVTVPLAKFVLNCDVQSLRLGRLSGSAFVGFVIFVVGLSVIGQVIREPMPSEFYGYSLLATCSAVSIAYVGISAIRADGLRLRTKTNWLAESTLPVTEAQKFNAEEYLHQHGKRHRVQVFALVLLTVGMNTYVNVTQSRAARFERNIAQFRAKLDELGCQYGINPGNYVAVRMGHSKQDDDFNRALRLQQEARELGMQKMISKLDFSGCEINDNALTFWFGFDNVHTLDVSDTDVRLQSTYNLQNIPLRKLRAANLDLSVAAWHQLNLSALESLDLRGSKIDADELATSLAMCKLKHIDLSGADLSESLIDRIVDQADLEKLSLAETFVDDAFVDRLDLRNLVEIDLACTEVSDACCDLFGRVSPLGTVVLADNAITDAGVERLKNSDFGHLDLSKTSVTADAVKGWRTLPSKFILSETKVDDEIAEGLVGHNPRIILQLLDLRKTRVTDAVLPVLSQINCSLVDISDTAITGQALIKCVKEQGSPNVESWRVGAKQFSPPQLTTLEKLGVQVLVSK